MNFYRKKPVVIEAIQFFEETLDEVRKFCPNAQGPFNDIARGDAYLIIPTLEGQHHAVEGDYIIKGIAGEFYPCKPDIFEQTYESVDAPGKSVSVGDKVWFICWDNVANAWVADEEPYPIEEVGTKGFFVSYDDEEPVEFDEYVLYDDIGDECFLSYEDAVAAAAVKAPKEIRFEENPVPDEGEDHD